MFWICMLRYMHIYIYIYYFIYIYNDFVSQPFHRSVLKVRQCPELDDSSAASSSVEQLSGKQFQFLRSTCWSKPQRCTWLRPFVSSVKALLRKREKESKESTDNPETPVRTVKAEPRSSGRRRWTSRVGSRQFLTWPLNHFILEKFQKKVVMGNAGLFGLKLGDSWGNCPREIYKTMWKLGENIQLSD